MSCKLAELLFNDYRRRVLSLLLLHPDDKYHVRKIARLTGTVAGTLHKELSRLAEVGVLQKESTGNQLQYSADRNCPIFEELAGILRKTTGVVDVLAEALAPIGERISTAFIFGSMASGKESVGSDVDVLIIGNVSFAEVVKAVNSAQETLRREINPKVYSRKEWGQKLKKKDVFVKEVILKPKLFLIGNKDEPG